MSLALVLSVHATGASPSATTLGSQLPDPIETLIQAELAAPYDVKVPASLPADVTLQHVTWDRDVGGRIVIDIWFALPNGGRLHVWQTNTTSQIESLPEGTPVQLAGEFWSLLKVDWGDETLVQLARRFDDGVAVAIDAPADSLSPSSVRRVVASVA